MPSSARILADSVSPDGDRLTTFELTFPRYVLAEMNTHRLISKNSASSRAIPTEKLIDRVINDPVIPQFGKNQPGMQAGEGLSAKDLVYAHAAWEAVRSRAVEQAKFLHDIGVHKQAANRLLEPFMFHTVIATATCWENFFEQRSTNHSPLADPAIAQMATMAEDLYREHTPVLIHYGEWHLPLFSRSGGDKDDYIDAINLAEQVDLDYIEVAKRVSTARCARVSYLTHDGKRDMQKDLDLFENTLFQHGHWSPLEHVATPAEGAVRGNFIGWAQFRHEVEQDLKIDTRR